MSNCDLCGKIEENMYKTLIEGVELEVCADCGKFGKVITPIKRPSAKEQHKQYIKRQEQHKEEKIKILVEDYSEIIKKIREAIGLTQKEFAKKINEKEATIHNLEVGALTPSLSLAKKLEKTLGIKLIEEHEEIRDTQKKKNPEVFTLGDFIKPR